MSYQKEFSKFWKSLKEADPIKHKGSAAMAKARKQFAGQYVSSKKAVVARKPEKKVVEHKSGKKESKFVDNLIEIFEEAQRIKSFCAFTEAQDTKCVTLERMVEGKNNAEATLEVKFGNMSYVFEAPTALRMQAFEKRLKVIERLAGSEEASAEIFFPITSKKKARFAYVDGLLRHFDYQTFQTENGYLKVNVHMSD
jgi:predicted RNA-binding protein YlxR (DUF448 family)